MWPFDEMSPLEKYAHEMLGRKLPPGPKVMCRMADGRWAVKVEVEGEVGYMLVDRTFHGTGGVFTKLEDLAKIGIAADGAFSLGETD